MVRDAGEWADGEGHLFAKCQNLQGLRLSGQSSMFTLPCLVTILHFAHFRCIFEVFIHRNRFLSAMNSLLPSSHPCPLRNLRFATALTIFTGSLTRRCAKIKLL